MKAGNKVQDFTLQNTKGEKVTLSDELKDGNVLLLFFPLAFSSVCTDEMCKVRDDMKLYKSLNANVLGISVDSFFTLNEFKKTNNLPFPLLSDFNKDVSSQFDVLNEDYYGMRGVSDRAAFVINPEMEVVYAERLKDSGKLPDFKAIQQTL